MSNRANPATVPQDLREKSRMNNTSGSGETNGKGKLPGRICMVVHSHYPVKEPRVRREAELLARSGVRVDVISLREKGESAHGEVNGVNIVRLPVRRHRGASPVIYMIEYLLFGFFATIVLTLRQVTKRYEVVQFHTLPDPLIFAGLFAKLMGAKLILDMHETMPDLMIDRLKVDDRHPAIRFTKLLERLSVRLADGVITVSNPVRETISGRVGRKDIAVVMNVADDKLFKTVPSAKAKGNASLMVYHGLVNESYDLRVVLKALAAARSRVPDLRFEIYGSGEMVDVLKSMVSQLNLNGRVSLMGFVPIEEVVEKIRRADIGVVPVTASYYARFALPTKLLEYAALGIPTLVPRFDTISAYFGDDMVEYYEPGSVSDLAEKMELLVSDPVRRTSLSNKSGKFNDKYDWRAQGEAYLEELVSVNSEGRRNSVSTSRFL